MALSEREQQMLDEMEQALYAEDPRFASSMKGGAASAEQRRRRIIGGVGVLVGLGLVILGVSTSVWVGVAGFAVIVASVALALAPEREGGLAAVRPDGTLGTARRPGGVGRAGRSSRPGGSSPRRPQRSGTFMERLEQRWERRRESGY